MTMTTSRGQKGQLVYNVFVVSRERKRVTSVSNEKTDENHDRIPPHNTTGRDGVRREPRARSTTIFALNNTRACDYRSYAVHAYRARLRVFGPYTRQWSRRKAIAVVAIETEK